MKKLNYMDWISLLLLFIGGLNWGLVGFFGFDLVSAVFGEAAILSRLIFGIVGIAALYSLIVTAPKIASLEECAQEPHISEANRGA